MGAGLGSSICATSTAVGADDVLDSRDHPCCCGVLEASEAEGTTASDGDALKSEKEERARLRRSLLHQKRSIEEVYELGRTLGEGSFGYVVLGTQKEKEQSSSSAAAKQQHRKPRAIKVIAKEGHGAQLAAIEINILSGLTHPNVVMLYETFEDATNVFMAMELCEGGDLFDTLVEDTGLTEVDVVPVMQQVLRSVAYCHQMRVAHRDIKGENFLIQAQVPIRSAIIKLVDFGAGCRFRENEPMTTAVGTPMYTAPEVLRRCYSEKCDVWSCGVLLYVLLSGTAPFDGEDETETFKAVIKAPLKFPQGAWAEISSEAMTFITSLLNRKVNNRPSAVESLHSAWLSEEFVQTRASMGGGSRLHARLCNFCGQSTLKKLALEIVARRIDEADVGDMRQAFVSLDTELNGIVSISALRQGMTNEGDSEVTAVLEQMDKDGDGTLDYRDFLTATMDANYYHREDVINDAFHVFDTDGTGSISSASLQKVLDTGDLRQTSRKGLNKSAASTNGGATSSAASTKTTASTTGAGADVGAESPEPSPIMAVSLTADEVFAEIGKRPGDSVSFEEFRSLMMNDTWNAKDKAKMQDDRSAMPVGMTPLRSSMEGRGSLNMRFLRSNMSQEASMHERSSMAPRSSQHMTIKHIMWEETTEGTWKARDRLAGRATPPPGGAGKKSRK